MWGMFTMSKDEALLIWGSGFLIISILIASIYFFGGWGLFGFLCVGLALSAAGEDCGY
jgi:hypothetical protein